MNADADTPAVDVSTDTDTHQSRKRPATSPNGTTFQRRPRGRYTPVACDGCKKRKMKCTPVENKASCERCLDNGMPCRYTQAQDKSQSSKNKSESRQYHTLQAELGQLRQEVANLSETVKVLSSRVGGYQHQHQHPQDVAVARSPPKQPQFVGPTNSALRFNIGEHSLTRMGIPVFEEPSRSRTQSPSSEPSDGTPDDLEFWPRCTTAEVVRLLNLFKDEIESIYPYIDTDYLASRAQDILEVIQSEETGRHEFAQPSERANRSVDYKDVQIVKVAMCTAIIMEKQGKTELTNAIIKPIENSVSMIVGPEVDLKQVQLLASLCAYYFHCDENLLAWRAIGVAARAALEMGLHRKRSLFDNFPDEYSRQLAIRLFWCIYLLDRRYSFGTGLSFALSDNDIDPNLPRPGPEFAYLNCMIGYGMLCSKIWNAIPPFGSPSSAIPVETAAYLDQDVRDWMDSIPSHLKLRHPRERPTSQPDVLHRLRAILHLRGNHTRILVHQHHLYSATSIAADPQSARLAVDIAKDSVEVLVHLNETSDIYSRQQSAFNYFLIGSISAIFLAVCHAPRTFSEPCRQSFADAVKIIRGFSHQSAVSRRTWKSIRGLLPRLKRLGLQGLEEAQNIGPITERREVVYRMDVSNAPIGCVMGNTNVPAADEDGPRGVPSHNVFYDGNFDGSFPDALQMGDDLMDLFDTFGQWEQGSGEIIIPKVYGEDDTFAMSLEGGASLLFPGFI